MSPFARRALGLGAGALLVLALGAGFALLRLDRAVSREASPEALRAGSVRPLAFRALERTGGRAVVAGEAAVLGAAEIGGELWLASGRGLEAGTRRLDVLDGLPSLRVSAVASWRGTPVFALERSGWGRVTPAGLEMATSGFGDLEVRSIVETEGGELLLGAREGLFRAAFGSGEIERLDTSPVRAVAVLPGGEVAAGGEAGLRVVSPSGATPRAVATPEPWVESLAFSGGLLWAATPAGAAAGPPSSARLETLARGADATSGVAWNGGFSFVATEGPPRVSLLLPDGARRETPAPERFRRLFVAEGRLLADGPSGLFGLDTARGFALVRPAPPSLPLPHVNALAADGSRLWLGFFDGGVASADPRATPLRPEPVASSDAWGVNALLPSGGAVWAATLRGAYRLAGGEARVLEGAGGAYALASTPGGVAVGYAQGVLLPGQRLLSAWHGLPGNQAYALAAEGDALWVGTPTGLGRVEGRRVTERVLPGEGKLPHPWVTALHAGRDGLWVATYGGGIAVRRAGEGPAAWEPFPQTRGLRVNAGALLALPDGRLCAGTHGAGVWCSDRARSRFARVDLPLPSPDVFSLAAFPPDAPELLFAGTSEGLLRVPADALTETR